LRTAQKDRNLELRTGLFGVLHVSEKGLHLADPNTFLGPQYVT